MNQLVVLSPHYDDAVLSAGQLIKGHHNPKIVTVCSGIDDPDVQTEYDKNCGFSSAKVAVFERSAENVAAAEILGADTESLGLLDDQYGGSTWQEHEEKLMNLFSNLGPGDTVLAPLATRHPDHQKVMNAALDAGYRLNVNLYLYEELPHRVLWPEDVEFHRREVEKTVRSLKLGFIGDGPMDYKEFAVNRYKSQLWSLDQRCIFVPERFWGVTWR